MSKLLIISHTRHYRSGDQLVGWGPTVRELDYLARLFDEVVHVAPLHADPAPASMLPYAAPNLRLHAVNPAGGDGLADKLGILRLAPAYRRAFDAELADADAVHVRCPANISLIALLHLMRRTPKRPCWYKYAGNWQPSGPEAWSYRLQRRLLRGGRHAGAVTVNGRWSDQPAFIHSFNNPSLTQTELAEGCRAAQQKRLDAPLSLLFVGRLETAKGVGRLLHIAQELALRGLAFGVDFVGDGPERAVFEAQAERLGLSRQVRFHGWLPRPALAEFYRRAHFFVLPSSASEGWPKVLSEAMAYGTAVVASTVSSIPQVLRETGAGTAVVPDNIVGFADAICGYVQSPDRWRAASTAGTRAAYQFSYDYYLQRVQALFQDTWQMTLPVHTL